MTSTRERYAWLDRAECRDHPDWDEDTRWRLQLQICRRCPVSLDCLRNALDLRIGGIRGGTTTVQRRQLLGDPGKRLKMAGTEEWTRMRDGRPVDPAADDVGLWQYCQRILAHGSDPMHPLGQTLRRPPGSSVVEPDAQAGAARQTARFGHTPRRAVTAGR